MRVARLLSLSVVSAFLLNACGGASGSGTGGGGVQPLVITSAALPSGSLQTAYGASGGGFSLAASGGVAPYAWSWTAAAGSSLPPGLALASSGLISGTPTSVGSLVSSDCEGFGFTAVTKERELLDRYQWAVAHDYFIGSRRAACLEHGMTGDLAHRVRPAPRIACVFLCRFAHRVISRKTVSN